MCVNQHFLNMAHACYLKRMSQWYPGDGRVLPLEEALKLVSVFVRQEMRLRMALVSGDAVAASPVSLAGVKKRGRESSCRQYGVYREVWTCYSFSFVSSFLPQFLLFSSQEIFASLLKLFSSFSSVVHSLSPPPSPFFPPLIFPCSILFYCFNPFRVTCSSALFHVFVFLFFLFGFVSLAVGVAFTTEALLSSRWEAGLESAASPLLSFLQGMGAQHLCVRVVAGMMALPPPSAVEVLGDAFSGLADKVGR